MIDLRDKLLAQDVDRSRKEASWDFSDTQKKMSELQIVALIMFKHIPR